MVFVDFLLEIICLLEIFVEYLNAQILAQMIKNTREKKIILFIHSYMCFGPAYLGKTIENLMYFNAI